MWSGSRNFLPLLAPQFLAILAPQFVRLVCTPVAKHALTTARFWLRDPLGISRLEQLHEAVLRQYHTLTLTSLKVPVPLACD